MRRPRRWARRWRSERGSQSLQSAGAALVAALLVGTLLAGANVLGPAVQRAFVCAASALGGGDASCGGAAVAPEGSVVLARQPAPPSLETGQRPDRDKKPCPQFQPGDEYVVNDPLPTDTIELYQMVSRRYPQGSQTADEQQGPVGITQIGENRYLVTLVGIEWDSWSGANALDNAALDQLGINSEYYAVVRETLEEQIPPGAEIVLAGHSHGGIVAQNLARSADFNANADRPLMDRLLGRNGGEYRVTHVITYGSPVSGAPASGTQYRMFANEGDPVSNLSVMNSGARREMERNGQYIYIPRPPDDVLDPERHGGLFGPHGSYADTLRALRDNPNSPFGPGVYELPFKIEMWSRTETFRAQRWDAYNQWGWPFDGRCR